MTLYLSKDEEITKLINIGITKCKGDHCEKDQAKIEDKLNSIVV